MKVKQIYLKLKDGEVSGSVINELLALPKPFPDYNRVTWTLTFLLKKGYANVIDGVIFTSKRGEELIKEFKAKLGEYEDDRKYIKRNALKIIRGLRPVEFECVSWDSWYHIHCESDDGVKCTVTLSNQGVNYLDVKYRGVTSHLWAKKYLTAIEERFGDFFRTGKGRLLLLSESKKCPKISEVISKLVGKDEPERR